MRFYPEQKTRSLRSQGRLEDAAIRHRHGWHVWTKTSYPVLHLFARAMRIAMKGITGGYRADVPTEHLEWLRVTRNEF
jgi:hypothetical protein